MNVSLPGVEYESRVSGFPAGLVGTVGFRRLSVAAAVLVARATSNIEESPAGSGSYATVPTAPADYGRYVDLWDRGGTVTPSTVAAELLEVTADGKPQQFGEDATVAFLFAGFPTGLVGTLGVRILNSAGQQTTGRSTAGIVEILAGSGVYVATVVCPPAGIYTVLADSGVVGPSSTASDQLIVAADATPPPWEPQVAEVAARIPSRARDTSGRIPTFTDATQPTGRQVQEVIDNVVAKLTGRFGIPAHALIGAAKEVALLEAAMRVELDFFADQVQAGRSPYNELKTLRDEALADYITDRSQLGSDGQPGTADDQSPIYSFPPLDNAIPVIDAEMPIDAIAGGPIW